MTMDNRKVVSTLNTLLETTEDGIRGFVACAEGVTSSQLKMVFETAARRCEEGAEELKTAIRSLGGEPVISGSVSGSLHRAWTSIVSSVTGMDEHAVLEECERGEDAAKSAYEKALDEGLPPEVEAIVRRQYKGVKDNHDRIRDLRNQTAHAG
jgi:uncharacterized protein (TIGR02284 family)